MKSFSSPFSSCKSNIDYISHIENDNYIDLLNDEMLVAVDSWGKRVLRHKKYALCDNIYEVSCANGFEFTHHDVLLNDMHNSSYKRKINRMLEARMASQVNFIYHHRINGKSNILSLSAKLNNFAKIYKGYGVKANVILFYQGIIKDASEKRLIKEGRIDQVYSYKFLTTEYWGGANEDILWARGDDELFKEMFVDFYKNALD